MTVTTAVLIYLAAINTALAVLFALCIRDFWRTTARVKDDILDSGKFRVRERSLPINDLPPEVRSALVAAIASGFAEDPGNMESMIRGLKKKDGGN